MGGLSVSQRKKILLFLFFLFILSCGVTFYTYKTNHDILVDKLYSYILKHKKELPVDFDKPTSIMFNPLQFSIEIRGISVKPLEENKKEKLFKPFKISSLHFHISFKNLISFITQRSLEFSKIIVNVDNLIILKNSLKLSSLPRIKKKVLDLEFPTEGPSLGRRVIKPKVSFPFQKIPKINLTLNIKNLSFKSKNLNLSLETLSWSSSPKNKDSLRQKLSFKKLDIEFEKHKFSNLSLETDFLIQNDLSFRFNKAKINYLKSQIIFSGNSSFKDNSIKVFGKKSWKADIYLNLSDFKKIYPNYSGLMQLNLEYEFPNLNVELEAEKFQLQNLNFENIQSRFAVSNKKISIESLDLSNKERMERISLEKISFYKNNLPPFKIKLQNFEAGHFLEKHVKLKLTGTLSCSIEKLQLFSPLSCQTQDDFLLKNINIKDRILAEQFQSQFQFHYKKSVVQYSADINGIKLKGKSLPHQNQHELTYQLKSFPLSQFEKIYKQKVSGQATVVGRFLTKNGKTEASFQSFFEKIDLKNTPIKSLKTHVIFKNDILYLKDMESQFHNSFFKGNLAFDFKSKLINFDINSKDMNTLDLSYLDFKNNPNFKILMKNFLGEGSFRLTGSSDFNMSDLDFNFELSLFRGSFFKEYFDHIYMKVESRNSNMKLKNSFLERDKERISLSGSIKSNNELDIKMKTNKFYLDPIILKGFLPIFKGILSFESHITGKIDSPTVKTKGTLENDLYLLKDNKVSFSLDINKDYITGDFNFFKERLVTSFKIPRKDHLPLNIKGSTKNFDFLDITPFLTRRQRENITGSLSSQFQISSKNANFWNATGFLNIKKLSINSGEQSFKNKKPINLAFSNGYVKNRTPFEIFGQKNQFIKIKTSNLASKDSLNLDITGSVSANFLHFLLPISLVDGDTRFRINIQGPYKNLKSNGHFKLSKGFLKLKQLEHPFEQIEANVKLENNHLSIESFKAKIYNTSAQAQGSMKLFQKDSLPLNLSLKMLNFNLEYPRGLKTQGDLTISIKGNHKPYDLTGTIDIKKGTASSKINDENIVYIYLNPFLQGIKPKDFANFFKFHNLLVKSQNFKFSNKNFNMSLRGQVSLLGGLQRPVLSGRVHTLPQSQFSFQNNSFSIQRGVLVYNKTPLDNPRVFLIGNTELNTSTELYKIQLKVEGHAKENKITLTSNPPLTHFEILTLLNSKISPEELDDFSNLQEEITTRGIYQVGSIIFSNLLGHRIKNTLGVDVQLLSADEDNLKDDSTVSPKIKVERQISDKLNLSVSRTFGELEENKIDLIYKLTNSWSLQASWTDDKKNSKSPSSVSGEPETQSFDINFEYKKRFK